MLVKEGMTRDIFLSPVISNLNVWFKGLLVFLLVLRIHILRINLFISVSVHHKLN